MIFERMFSQNTILGYAADAASVRNDVIVNNIANNDVPGFKAKAVDFEDSLIKALERYKRTGELDLSDVRASVRHTNANLNYRIDENNVDIDLEMVNLYQNSVKYDAMITCVQSNTKRFTLALTGR